MGVFSYLNIKKPASIIWKALSPSRELSDANNDSNSDISNSLNNEEGVIKRGFCSPNVERAFIPIGRNE